MKKLGIHLLQFCWLYGIIGYFIFLSVDFRIYDYNTFKKYNNTYATVVDVYTSSGKYSSSEYLQVKLCDGRIISMCGGYKNWKVGDSVYNSFKYDYVIGNVPDLQEFYENDVYVVKGLVSTILCIIILMGIAIYIIYLIYKYHKFIGRRYGK